MKIVLFATPFENISNKEASYPLGIAYIGAVLAQKKYDVKVYDFLFEKWEEAQQKIKKIVEKEKPDIVGLSSMTTNRTSSFKTASIIKTINPHIKIIIGGVHPTIMHQQIIENFPIDFVVIGEGESTIIELVRMIEKKKSINEFKNIEGICFRIGKEIIKTKPREFIKDLDNLPAPNHSYFKEKIMEGRTFYLTTSRGCPYSCTFCSSSQHWGRMIRRRSPKKVIEELKSLKKQYPFVKRAIFNDDEFLINSDWVKKFCNLLKKEKLDIGWACAARVTSVNEEIIREIKSAGCTSISLGLESGSLKMLKYMNKCITLEQVKKAFDICKKHNLYSMAFLMVGLPGETSKTINETIKFLKTLPVSFVYMPSVYHVFPGTRTYELAKKQGFITDEYWLTDKTAPFYTYNNSKLKLIYWSFKIAFFYNLYHGRLLNFIFSMLKANLRIDQIKRVIKRYFI